MAVPAVSSEASQALHLVIQDSCRGKEEGKIGDRGTETRRFRSVPRLDPGLLLHPGSCSFSSHPGSATVRFSPLQRGQLQAPLFQEWERHLSHQGRLDELFLLVSDSTKAGEDHCPLPIMFITSSPCNVRPAVSMEKKPIPALTRRLMNRWSCSTRLFKSLTRL